MDPEPSVEAEVTPQSTADASNAAASSQAHTDESSRNVPTNTSKKSKRIARAVKLVRRREKDKRERAALKTLLRTERSKRLKDEHELNSIKLQRDLFPHRDDSSEAKRDAGDEVSEPSQEDDDEQMEKTPHVNRALNLILQGQQTINDRLAALERGRIADIPHPKQFIRKRYEVDEFLQGPFTERIRKFPRAPDNNQY